MRSGYKLRLFAATAAALILCVLFALWYPGYMRKYRLETCEKARRVLEYTYTHKVEAALSANGGREDDVDYEKLLQESYRECFGRTPGEDGRISGICRGGGTWTTTIDPETHHIRTVCDADGHGAVQTFVNEPFQYAQ